MKKETKIYFIVSLVFIFIAIVEGILLVFLSNKNEKNNNVINNNTVNNVIDNKDEKKDEKKDNVIPEEPYIKLETEIDTNSVNYEDYSATIIFYINSNEETYEEWFCFLGVDGFEDNYFLVNVSEEFKELYEMSSSLEYMDVSTNFINRNSNIEYSNCKPPLSEKYILEYVKLRNDNPELDYGEYYNTYYKKN